MTDSELEPDPAERPEPPRTPHGCWIAAGFFLAGALGFAGGVLAGVLNAPHWVVPVVFFGTPAVYVVAVCVLSIRRTRKYGVAGLTAEQRALAPLTSAFALVGVVSFGGMILAIVLDAPFWVAPVAFLAPPVLFVAFAWPYLKTLPDRLKRAAPSPEKAAALTPKPRRRAEPTAPDAFPTVPVHQFTPGTRLAHRLPDADVSVSCACLGVLAMAAFWNGIVSVFVWQVVEGFRRGKPEWFMVVFLIPFVLVGLVLVVAVVATVWYWVVSLLAGKLRVEVDDHPLAPGGRYRAHVAQTGLFRLTKVGVELVCEEAATYQSGTTESTDKKVVAKHPAELPEPLPAAPLDFTLVVPADAMHSFEAKKNEINWKVTVWGRVLGVLPYQRAFEVVVRPGAANE